MDMQSRNYTSNDKNKNTSPPVPLVLNFKAFTAFLRPSKAILSVGAITCAAFGSFLLASSFQTTPSKETAELVAFLTAKQASPPREKYTISETDLLKQQLQSIHRELEEYKAHLFRASHPSDQAKIAELGHLLAEKERLSHQLTAALQTFEKELHAARKHAATLELTTEVLGAMLQTQKSLPNKAIINKSTVDYQAQIFYEELQTYHFYTSLLHTHMETQQNMLAKTIQKEHDLTLGLQEQLFAVEQIAASQFNELQELKKIQSDSVILASLLTHQLDDMSKKHADIQNEKNSLNDYLTFTKNALEDKTEYANSLHKQINELTLHSQHHQQESMELETNLQKTFQEIASLKQQLHETRAAKDELSDELASVESLMEDLKEQSKMSMVQYSLALQAGDDLEDQINVMQRKLKEKESTLEDSEESITMLQSFIQELTNDNLALQKENNWLSTQHEDDQELLVQYNKHIQSLKDQVAKADETLSDTFAHYDSASKELEEELKSFKIRLANEEDKNDLLQERLAVLIVENNAKTADSTSFKNELESSYNTIAELEASLEAQNALITASGLEIKAHEETTSLLHIKYNSEIEELKAQQEEHLSEISKLHGHLHAFTEKYASSGQRNTDLEAQIRSLISNLEEAEYALNQSKHQENDLVHQTAELERRIHAMEQGLATAHENNKHFQALADAREGELTAIQIALQDQIEKLSRELQEKNQDLAERTH